MVLTDRADIFVIMGLRRLLNIEVLLIITFNSNRMILFRLIDYAQVQLLGDEHVVLVREHCAFERLRYSIVQELVAFLALARQMLLSFLRIACNIREQFFLDEFLHHFLIMEDNLILSKELHFDIWRIVFCVIIVD